MRSARTGTKSGRAVEKKKGFFVCKTSIAYGLRMPLRFHIVLSKYHKEEFFQLCSCLRSSKLLQVRLSYSRPRINGLATYAHVDWNPAGLNHRDLFPTCTGYSDRLRRFGLILH
jgi:hypothetical protein